jgi:DNA-binding CsgD family transcriptional regulator
VINADHFLAIVSIVSNILRQSRLIATAAVVAIVIVLMTAAVAQLKSMFEFAGWLKHGSVVLVWVTPREPQILMLIAGGRSMKWIAQELAISEDTVKGHVRNILAKLNAYDRTHAVTLAIRRGDPALTPDRVWLALRLWAAPGVRGTADAVVQSGARRAGSDGIGGNAGIVESVTYRIQRT